MTVRVSMDVHEVKEDERGYNRGSALMQFEFDVAEERAFPVYQQALADLLRYEIVVGQSAEPVAGQADGLGL